MTASSPHRDLFSQQACLLLSRLIFNEIEGRVSCPEVREELVGIKAGARLSRDTLEWLLEIAKEKSYRSAQQAIEQQLEKPVSGHGDVTADAALVRALEPCLTVLHAICREHSRQVAEEVRNRLIRLSQVLWALDKIRNSRIFHDSKKEYSAAVEGWITEDAFELRAIKRARIPPPVICAGDTLRRKLTQVSDEVLQIVEDAFEAKRLPEEGIRYLSLDGIPPAELHRLLVSGKIPKARATAGERFVFQVRHSAIDPDKKAILVWLAENALHGYASKSDLQADVPSLSKIKKRSLNTTLDRLQKDLGSLLRFSIDTSSSRLVKMSIRAPL